MIRGVGINRSVSLGVKGSGHAFENSCLGGNAFGMRAG